MSAYLGPSQRWFTQPAGLGEEIERMGNIVRPVLLEYVAQKWNGGQIVEETSEIKTSGRVALVIGPDYYR